MQPLTITYVVVIENYDHMTTLDENVNDELANLLSNFSLNLRGPFVHLPLLHNKLITFLDVNAREI